MSSNDIEKVKINLANMQDYNDYIYSSGNDYIANCFLLLGQQDDQDPGFLVGMSLLEGCMGAVFSCMGFVGAFSSCFLCSIVSDWSYSKPPGLMETCANMLMRFDKSHVQLDNDISVYIQNPEKYWDKEFTWNGTTITLGDLSTIDFPDRTNPDFYVLADVSLAALDRSVWGNTLKIRCKHSKLAPYNHCECTQVKGDTNIYQWDVNFIANNPQYYCTWYWHADEGMFDKNYWYVSEQCINFNAGNAEKLHLIPTGACQYLFIDSADGHVINENGLFYRNYVFNGMGLTIDIIRTNTPNPN